MVQRGHGKTRRLYFILRKMKRKSSNGNGSFVHDRIVSAVKSVELVSDTVSCIDLRGRWCKVIVLSSHAPTEEKIYDS